MESKINLYKLTFKVYIYIYNDPEGWYGEGGGRRVQDGEHMRNKGIKKKRKRKKKKESIYIHI